MDSARFVHDMKNLLGIVLGYSSILVDEMPPDDPHRADIDQIAAAGEQALKLLTAWAAKGQEVV